MRPGRHTSLLPAAQRLSDDGRFRYRGGELPLAPPLGDRAVVLAERAIGCVPGLRGYVGVDVVLGEQDVAVEINPRLTTSYVGLRALAGFNLAAAVLAAANGEPLPPLSWRVGQVCFSPDGQVRPKIKLG